jgi:D-threo-aldose 1-dehydrogenase
MSVELGSLSSVGHSDLEVGPLGLGTAPLGGWPTVVPEPTVLATVRRALEFGIRFVDTAPLYGHGLSELRLGRALAGVDRDSYVLATKAGRLLCRGAPLHLACSYEGRSLFAGEHEVNPVFDFSHDGALRSVDESLERLGIDRVDIVHIHDPDDHHDEALAGTYVALDELRSQGVIGAVGAGMNQSEMLARFAREGDFDCFLLAGRYTLLEQGALDELLPLCVDRGISVFAGGVFNSGVIIDPRPGATYNYVPAPPEVIARAQGIGEVCRRHDVPPAAPAIQFPLAHPAVATVLVGARSPAELEEDVRLAQLPIPDDLWAELREEGFIRDDAPVPAQHDRLSA